MKCIYLSALAALTLASSVFACGDDDYIGSICTTSANFCPANTLEANGQLLTVNQNQALYSLLGNVYGGTPNVNFNLPDLRGRAPVGIGTGKSLNTVLPGQKRGAESVALTTAQMPQHTHAAIFTPSSGVNPIAVNVPINPNSGSESVPTATVNYLSGSSVGGTGGNMWSSTPSTPPVSLAGVTVSGDTGSGSVAVATMGSAAPVSTLSPELGLKYCVVTRGEYPPRQ